MSRPLLRIARLPALFAAAAVALPLWVRRLRAAGAGDSASTPASENLTAAELAQRLARHESIAVIDVRPVAAYGGAQVGVCASCMDARGITDAELSADCRRSSMAELAAWTSWSDKVIVF